MATKAFHRTGLVLSILAFVFHFIAFASPYWYKSWDRVHSPFGNIGLWHVCLSGFIMPRDPVMKSYVGCWWIHSSEFSAIDMELMPVWFRFVQAFCVFVLVGDLFAMIFTAVYLVPGLRGILYKKRPRMFFINSALLLGSALLVFLISLVFAEMSNDSDWMPRPWMNHLSWSYGLCVTSGFFSAFGGMALFILALIYADKEERGEPNVTTAAEMARKQRELEKQDEAMRSQPGMIMDPYPSQRPQYGSGSVHTAGGRPQYGSGQIHTAGRPQYGSGQVYNTGRGQYGSGQVYPAGGAYKRDVPDAKKAPSDAGSGSTRVGESFV